MTFPAAPAPRAAQPGEIPLRPLAVGEILGISLRIWRADALALGLPALVVSLLGSALGWAVLGATGTVTEYADATWAQTALTSGRMVWPSTPVLVATLLPALVSAIGAVVVAGLAAVPVSRAAVGRPAGAVGSRTRMTGRQLLTLVVLAVVVAVGTVVGLALLVVPGVLLYLAWFVAAPALVLEKASPAVALRRSMTLTQGAWGRLFGLSAALLAMTLAVTLLVSVLVAPLVQQASAVTALVVSDVVGALLAMLTVGWTGTAAAVAYVDLRLRREDLATALAAAARS